MTGGRGDETLDHLVGLGEPATVPPQVTVAGRYRLEAQLGSGAFGVVYGAIDELTGKLVAVKLLAESDDRVRPRLGREIDALRVLRVPGVVNLLDEGELPEPVFGALRRYIVMDRVSGAGFPGREIPCHWDDLAGPLVALLECLARVHDAGVVHRDLKPANVLVDDDGRPTLLDFGLARGEPLGGTITAADALVGTPRYLAPEQALHEGADGRADLYSLGAMVYEALSGRVPLEDLSQRNMLSLRLTREATPLAVIAPHTAPEAAAWVERLVRRDREERFPSAAAALRALRGFWKDPSHVALPTLGGDDALHAVLDAVARRRVALIGGPRGSGRTRLLRRAAAALRDAGSMVSFLTPGQAPFQSMGSVIGSLAEDHRGGLAEVVPAVHERVRTLAASGVVLLADDAERLDRWSRAAIEALEGYGGAVLVVGPHPNPTVRLGPLPEAALWEVFHGPDRVLHLREDGARELWRRTGGLPARVDAEAAAWVRAGLATWEDERLRVSRTVLDGLRLGVQLAPVSLEQGDAVPPLDDDEESLVAWVHLCGPHATAERLAVLTETPAWRVEGLLAELEARGVVWCRDADNWAASSTPQALHRMTEEERAMAHSSVARTLPRGMEGRLLHLLLAGDASGAAQEALALAEERRRVGQVADSIVALRQTLLLARGRLSVDEENQLLLTWEAALGTTRGWEPIDEVRHAIDRATRPSEAVLAMRRLLDVQALQHRSSPAAVLEAADSIGPLGDADLEHRRHMIRLAVAQGLPVDVHQRVLDEVAAWAAEFDDLELRPWLLNLQGMFEYRRCRYSEAAALHLAALELETHSGRRLPDLANAAAALMEAGDCRKAHELAVELLATARGCHNTMYEARGEVLARAATVRGGLTDTPDEDLLPALQAEGQTSIVAFHALTEASFYWRAGDPRVSRYARIAAEAFERLEWGWVALACRALELLCSGPHPAEAIAPHFSVVGAGIRPAVDFQAAALLWRATLDPPPEWADVLRRLAAALPEPTWSLPRELISVDEGLSWLNDPQPEIPDSPPG